MGLNTYFCLQKDEKWTLLDTLGQEILSFQHDSLTANIPFYTQIWREGKCGLFSQQSLKMTLSTEYDSITITDGGDKYAQIWQNGKCGLFDLRNQRIALPARYDSITKQPKMLVWQNGKCGAWNYATADFYLPIVYDKIEDTRNMPFLALLKNGKWAAYSEFESKIVSEHLFDSIQSLPHQQAHLLVKYNGKWGIWQTFDKGYALQPIYDSIQGMDPCGKVFLTQNGKQKQVWNLFTNLFLPLPDFETVTEWYRSSDVFVFLLLAVIKLVVN